jgi:transcriptional regulator with XRE-family HTH domain
VPGQTTDRPFNEELARLLSQRRLSQRKLAQLVDLNPAHLSRVIRGADRARPSVDLINRIADALGLPNDYFPEQREAAVIEMIRRDPALRDKIYRSLHEARAPH